MAGHSKWSNIKRKKGENDAKKSKIFSKLSKEITVACRNGNTDPALNPQLRLAIQNAKGMNMSKEAIARAISKHNGPNEEYQEVIYEGYGSHGVALIVVCMTNKITRTVANIRAIFSRNGGSLAKSGSLSFLFDQKGCFSIPITAINNEDDTLLALIDAGSEDIENDGEFLHITCPVEAFGTIQKKLETLGITPNYSGLQYIPNKLVELNDQELQKLIKLIDTLEDDEDVQRVHHNISICENQAHLFNV